MRATPALLLSCLVAGLTASAVLAADPQPVASSAIITSATPGHAVQLDVDIATARQLYLVATDGGDGFACDWAVWAEPRLTGPAGELRLTDVRWKSARSDWGQTLVNRNAAGQPLQIAGQSVSNGIGTHANSIIHFELPEGYTRFRARVGLDQGGTSQNNGATSSVQFHVYTAAPQRLPVGGGQTNRTPEEAVASLDAPDDLQVGLFAAEPLLLSPSNIDVDHLGRVWVCEVVNYRRFANASNPERTEGDRILILEDTNGDGAADKETTFYQGHDIDSAHGVCVLGNRVIVSAGDSVFSLYDDDGDLQCDRKEVLFTGIRGVQHDHGIHSFTFGPDGRLYFNFGNSGEELHYPDGSIVRDLSGREVRIQRQPYQEGLAFRCELDGSRVETLGWNFRNNWELCVDSFGTIWQSDNDDDGNRGVRINYVMEYGNYGYKDELTGAGWREPRTNLEPEIPLQHWHLHDPGVVPNLLQTGAGSPTGILIYEGDRLPARFLNQLIHCDAGPNVVRSYAVTPAGAGYRAEIHNILNGTRDQWFRPSDVCAAPDGSLIVADWYDPGVGGHRQGDVDRGRLFRVSLPGQRYAAPPLDLTTISGALAGLRSPNTATRYLAFRRLQESGAAAGTAAETEAALADMFRTDTNPRFRARALWLLGQLPGKTQEWVRQALADKDADLRITGLRLARRMQADIVPLVEQLVRDPSAAVRRECAIALRHCDSPRRPELWARLAVQHDGTDRWYLEALGLSADGQWDACLQALDGLLRDQTVPRLAVDSVLWRSRGQQSAQRIVSLILDYATNGPPAVAAVVPAASIDGLFRALDFQPRGTTSAAVRELLSGPRATAMRDAVALHVTAEALQRVGDIASVPEAQAALEKVLTASRGTPQFIQLVRRFQLQPHYGELLTLAQQHPGEQTGVEAIAALLDLKQWPLLTAALQGSDTAAAVATAEVLGNSANGAISGPLLAVIRNPEVQIDVRRAAVRAAARVNNAALELVKLADSRQLDPELTQAVAAALHASPSRQAREQALRLFPLPPSRDNTPLPPVSELLALQGDVTNGRLVFFTNGTCHKCHVVDGMGREIGPNLSEIGSKLSREALLESILYPSAGISHNYEAWTAVLNSGTAVTGLLTSQTDDSVSLKGDDALVRTFPRAEIEELVRQKISLMPADLQKTMSAQELADVVAYMQSLKKK